MVDLVRVCDGGSTLLNDAGKISSLNPLAAFSCNFASNASLTHLA